eukprot:COSAG02_NODE_70419_length_196_cov_20.432990_1_plen_60_part_01
MGTKAQTEQTARSMNDAIDTMDGPKTLVDSLEWWTQGSLSVVPICIALLRKVQFRSLNAI